MLSAKSLERKSEVLLLVASLETQEGLWHADAMRILQKYPKELAIEVIIIVLTARPGVKRIIAIGDVLEEFIGETDKNDIRDCFREADLRPAPFSKGDNATDSNN